MRTFQKLPSPMGLERCRANVSLLWRLLDRGLLFGRSSLAAWGPGALDAKAGAVAALGAELAPAVQVNPPAFSCSFGLKKAAFSYQKLDPTSAGPFLSFTEGEGGL